jgi:valyl-tRNA synthetase
VEELKAAGGDPAVFESAVAVLGQIRRYKTEARVSLRSPLVKITVEGPAAMLEKLCSALNDVLKAGAVEEADLRPCISTTLKVHVHTA